MNSWLSLKALLDSLESETEYGSLDRTSQRILEWVYVRTQEDSPLYIQEIIMKSGAASPASIYKALGVLELKGFIRSQVDGSDTRRRIITVSPSAKELISKLAKGVDAWRNEKSPRPQKN